MLEHLLETWHINNRINLYLPDAVEQFAHIHNVRLMWIKSAQPEILEKSAKFKKENALDKKILFGIRVMGNSLKNYAER